MAAAFQITALGDRALEEALRLLPDEVQDKVIKSSLRKALKRIIKPAIVARTPVKSGRLKAAMERGRIKVLRSRRGPFGMGYVMPKRSELGIDPSDPFYYPAMIEYGYTRSHTRGLFHSDRPVSARPIPWIRATTDAAASRVFRFLSVDIGKGIARRLKIKTRRARLSFKGFKS